MKTLSKIILLSFLSFFCLAQVSLAEECKDDPDQCTPKKLCDISTEMVNGLKFWTSNLDFDEHVNFAKEIGIDCGASDPKSACDLDANECKISELCEKATINEGDDVSWNTEAEAYVNLAKEYGMDCNVQQLSSSENTERGFIPAQTQVDKRLKLNNCSDDDLSACSYESLCEKATWKNLQTNEINWHPMPNSYVQDAKKRGWFCGLKGIGQCSKNFPENCSDDLLCKKSTSLNTTEVVWSNKTDTQHYVYEAKQRGLNCGVGTYPVVENENDLAPYMSMLREIEGNWAGIIKCPNNQNFPFKGTFSTKPFNQIHFDTNNFTYKGGFAINHRENKVTVIASRNDGKRYNQNFNYSKELKALTGQTSEGCFVTANKGQNSKNIPLVKQFTQNDFNQLNFTERKQIQYALKELGYYKTSIDGIYGPNTEKAVRAYAKSKGLTTNYPESIYTKLISEVKVPSSFATIKKSKKINTNKIANTKGWVPLSGNPKLSFNDAKDICEAKAEAEGQTYMSANQPRSRSNNFNCQSIGTPMPFGTIQFNNYSCSRNSGGFWGGFASAMENSVVRDAARDLAKAVAKACMADFGWVKK